MPSARMRGMETFDVTATVTYSPMVIPPRCRKPRPMPETFTHLIQVPSYTADEAPVAALVPLWESHANGDVVHEIRTVDGKLYRRSHQAPPSAEINVDARWANHRQEAAEAAEGDLEGRILIDGEVWRATSEPVYRIMTFGMGHNHGGTSVAPYIPWNGEDLDQSGYVSALEYDEAVEAAVKVAIHRGDDKSVDRLRDCSRIEVLIPEVFTLMSIAARQALAVAEAKAAVAVAAERVAAAAPEELEEAMYAIDEAVNVAWKAIRRVDL